MRALKHISTLSSSEGDISLIQGGAGTGKTFTAIQAIQMILKTKSQRVCLLTPDSMTLEHFINQMYQSEKFMENRKEVMEHAVILRSSQECTITSSSMKMPRYKELYIDMKSLHTFIKLGKRQDRDEILKFLNYESYE